MKKICLSLILMLVTFMSLAQVKKVIIKASYVQYGTLVKYKGLDVWKMDGERIVDEPLFIIKDGLFTIIDDDGSKSQYMFEERTEFRDDYTEIIFTIICKDGNKYHVKIDRAKCCIEFAYWNGIDWRLTRYEIEAILFK